jgi:hypothetical protein
MLKTDVIIKNFIKFVAKTDISRVKTENFSKI